MEIVYKEIKEIDQKKLQELFLSVSWAAANYPEKLQKAVKESHTVLSAWDGDNLAGLMTALADGAINVYFHYHLVDPEYQGMGIGKKLAAMMLDKYKDYLRKILIVNENQVSYYEESGFELLEDKVPMIVTTLKKK